MKFMKLGSRPDLFQAEGNSVRFVASELPTDIVVNVGEVRFYLHKFPLLAKCVQLQKLVLKASENSTESADEVHLYDFPGGPKAFEICAKFCYGMIVTLNAYNIVAARCAAEYLQMTEDIERGNLVFKIEVFLKSSVFRSWKDSIIVLQTTKSLLAWSEDLKIVGKCIDSIASKASVEPSSVNWSYTCGKKSALSDQIVEQRISLQQALSPVPQDWWVEDICDLDIDHYKRVMIAIQAKGRMSAHVIGEALREYVIRWLPNSTDDLVSDEFITRNKELVETIIWLLPSDKGSGCSCSILLKLLKVVMLIGSEEPMKEELVSRISMQLDKASIRDLLIPARPPCDMDYDVNLVQTLVNKFIMQQENNDSGCVRQSEMIADEFILGNAALLTVGKLIDGYLTEIASDPNLPLSSFVDLAGSIPVAGRPVHDALYAAIDIYLKEHPGLTKTEKKRLCRLMDVKKLSTNACVHAAQNEWLPLRVVVQILFFEHARAASGAVAAPSHGDFHGGAPSAVTIENWEGPAQEDFNSMKKQLRNTQICENECPTAEDREARNSCKNRGSALLLPSRSRRILDKLWVGKAKADNNRSSETSGSSQSPPTSVNPRETISSGSSSRHRRHSVS